MLLDLTAEVDDASFCLRKIVLEKMPGYNTAFDCCVFVSSTMPDFEAFAWCDAFTKKHFDMFIKRKSDSWETEKAARGITSESKSIPSGTGLDEVPEMGGTIANLNLGEAYTPKAHEPVAFASMSGMMSPVISTLPIPAKGKYVIIKLMPSASASVFGGNGVYLSRIHFEGCVGSHPLAPVLGTPAYTLYSEQIKREVCVVSRCANLSSNTSPPQEAYTLPAVVLLRLN